MAAHPEAMLLSVHYVGISRLVDNEFAVILTEL